MLGVTFIHDVHINATPESVLNTDILFLIYYDTFIYAPEINAALLLF
jgi:hypothetical protein